MMRLLALIYGLVLVSVGVGGMVPELVTGGKFMGILAVSLTTNLMHITVGILGLLCGIGGKFVSRVFFILLGLGTTVLAACGFMIEQGILFGLLAVNPAVNWAYAIIAITSLLIGFFL